MTTNETRVVPITVFVSVDDVQRAIGCSRSQAYTYLREAAGRRCGERGLLRVPAFTWERYATRRFHVRVETDSGSSRIRTRRGRRVALPTTCDTSVIPITHPRTPRRG